MPTTEAFGRYLKGRWFPSVITASSHPNSRTSRDEISIPRDDRARQRTISRKVAAADREAGPTELLCQFLAAVFSIHSRGEEFCLPHACRRAKSLDSTRENK